MWLSDVMVKVNVIYKYYIYQWISIACIGNLFFWLKEESCILLNFVLYSLAIKVQKELI